jgi:hypothetical protein
MINLVLMIAVMAKTLHAEFFFIIPQGRKKGNIQKEDAP